MNQHIWAFVLMVISGSAFVVMPHLDLMVSNWWYVASTGFIGNDYALVRWLDSLNWLFWVAALAILAVTLWYNRRKWLLESGYLLTCLVVGPGVVVNVVLKDNWGRARPANIVEFGGDQQFSPPWMISDQCATNCSFVSGHASSGFFLMALAFIPSLRKWRDCLLYIGLTSGFVSGFGRVLQGRHFMSDIVFSGAVVLLVSWVMARVFFKEPWYYSNIEGSQ